MNSTVSKFAPTFSAVVLSVLAIAAGGAFAAAGDLDPSFGGDGKVTTAFFTNAESGATVYAAALQPDGKIVAAGSASGPTSEFALARYNADGSPDTSFSGDGKLTTDIFGGQDYAYAVAVQADGKIVAVGAANINAASFFSSFALVRYNANGSLDTTFGSGGKVGTDFGGATSAATAVALQPDGKIVVAGSASEDGVINRFALARYNVNGSLDTSFGSGGKVSTAFFGFDDSASALALQDDGKILALGQAYPGGANNQFALARYNADGSLDASFGTDGKVTTDFFGANDHGQSIVLQPGGKIIAAGTAYVPGTGIDHFAAARYTADGSLDTTFGTGGKTSLELSFAWVRRWSAAGQADGKLVAASWGVDSASGFDHIQLARLNADGSLDLSFSADGKLTTTFFGSQNQAYAVKVQADGKILAAGSAYDVSTRLGHFALARYDAGGGTAHGATLASLTVAPTSLVGGSGATGSLTLSAAAPTGGAIVALADNSTAATVPASVNVAAGAASANFPITTSAVSTSTPISITGSHGGVSRSATLTLTASAPAAPALIAPANAATPALPVAFDWSDVAGAADYEIQVDDSSTIAAPFRANQIVSTSQVSIGGLPAQQLWWRVRARTAAGVFGPFSAARRFTPQAAPASASLSSLAVNPTSVVGGNSSTGIATLTAAAPAGGAVVALSSSNTAVAAVPASLNVPAGSTSANFTVTTLAVGANTGATIAGTYNGTSRTATLSVTPVTLPATATLTVAATGRSGERITSSPAGINVLVGSSQSASSTTNTSVTLSVTNNREAIWTGACSSGGNKTRTCTFTMTGNASVTGNVQ